MATKKPVSKAAAATTRGLSFDEFVQIAVKSATAATKTLGPHPIWIGIIIRPPELENPEVVAGGTNR